MADEKVNMGPEENKPPETLSPPGQKRQSCKAQQVNGGFKHMNVLRIRLSLPQKREAFVAAGQFAFVAADGAAQSAISRFAVLVIPDKHRIVVIC